MKNLVMISPEAGAKTITYLATSSDVERKIGLYFEKNRAKMRAPLARGQSLVNKLWVVSALGSQ